MALCYDEHAERGVVCLEADTGRSGQAVASLIMAYRLATEAAFAAAR